MRPLTSLGACLLLTCGAIAAPSPTIVHVDPSATTTIRTRTVSDGVISSTNGTASMPGDVRRTIALRSPDTTTVAMVSIDASGNARLHEMTDQGIGSAVTLANSVASPSAMSAAYTSPLGRLLFAYGTTGSSTCWVKSYAQQVSDPITSPIALSSAPVRIEMAPRAGSNEVLIVAQDSSLKLAATVWDGENFRATTVLDTAYDGGVNRWDITWTHAGKALVTWARSTDTALRVSTLTGDTWESMINTPTALSAIGRVRLVSDPARGSERAAVAITTATGRADIAVFGGTSWSSTTNLTGALATDRTRPIDLSFEGAGSGLVCAWIDSSATRVSTRRRAANGDWGNATTSSDVGSTIEEVQTNPVDGAADVCVLIRREEAGSGGGVGTISGYVVYAATGPITNGDRVTYNGLRGANVAGVTLPTAPTGDAGTSNVTLGHDANRTFTPGSYKDLSFGDRARLNFSAGTYFFRKLTSSGHDTRIICNTSGGDVTIVFLQNSVTFRDRFRIEKSGSGAVGLFVEGGSLTVGHDANMEALLCSHAGSFQAGDRTRLTGHIFTSAAVRSGHDGSFSPPSWSYTGGGGSVTVQRLYAMLVRTGTPGTVSDLSGTDGIETEEMVPMAFSMPATPRGVRLVRWSEVEPTR